MTTMTAEALDNDKELGIPLVLVKKIYLDHEFNCREHFSASSCIELAADIAKRGLQQPVVVRKLRSEEIDAARPSEKHLIDRGFEYVMIAGHRRLTAYKINNAEMIPAIIKPSTMSAFEAHDLNAIENLQRKELTIAEEAYAIKHYWLADWTRGDIASQINKSPGWVQVRCMLLSMPDEVMDVAHNGYLTTTDIRKLYTIKNKTQLLKEAGLMRDARKRGEKAVSTRLRVKDKPTTKKQRTKGELQEMMGIIRDTFKNRPDGQVDIELLFTDQGNGLATRCLAWASGEITAYEFHTEIKFLAEKLGLTYNLPEFRDDIL